MRKHLGFTLIEVLVVIALIGLLSSLVLVALNSARTKGKYAKAQTDLQQLTKIAQLAQLESGQRLQLITGSGCSDCNCRNMFIQNISATSTCYTQWVSALNSLITATNSTIAVNAQNLYRDPWGSPYGLDENEGESGGCNRDYIRSAGADGILLTSDDIGGYIPLSRIPCP